MLNIKSFSKLLILCTFIFTGCSVTEIPSFEWLYSDIKSANHINGDLEGSVNALVTWDFADALSVNVARACSSAPDGADCSKYMREAVDYLQVLNHRCFDYNDGLSCGKGALLATHLEKKTESYNFSDNIFFSQYFIKMVKKGCELDDAASCDDYGYQFLSLSERLSLVKLQVKVSKDTAVRYFDKACSLGNVTSCERLLVLYETGALSGYTVKPDRELSVKYTKRACELNRADMVNPSRCSELGNK